MHLPVLSAATIGVGSTTEFIAWIGEQREALRRDLARDGALLVRGLPALDGPESFGQIAREFAPTLRNYLEGQSRRDELAPQVYNSTHHPANQPITLHHELSYAPEPPRWIFFGCKVAAKSGGATPLLDGRQFLTTLPTRIRRAFEGRGILYVKTMPATRGMGKSWQQHYETDDKATVEEYLERTGNIFEWTDRGALRIQRVVPAISPHPETGELVWFNQANLWHISNLGEVGRALQETLGERHLPTHAFWENGDPIPNELINEVRQLMWDGASAFPWQEGDVLFVDNRSVMHGRQPYVGDRLLYVAMA
jgi:alpha-ketoglutarate-dependent taurine dioxygenase